MSENTSNFNSGYNYGTISQVNNKTYNIKANSVQFNTRSADQDPLNVLYQYTAAGALHNSADRVDAPKCHEETRKAVQEDIFSWISSGGRDSQPRQLLWLTGPAGSGKTAIMGTVSDKLREDGQLAASFFFSSFAGPERRSNRSFVGTLAYQLQLHPTLKGCIRTTMLENIQRDPALFQMSLKQQADALILQPLRGSQGDHSHGATEGPPMVIVIDGVDECREGESGTPAQSGEKEQLEILSVLLHVISDPVFPFRIVVASRPEDGIRRFFANAVDSVMEIFLDNRYDPDKDIGLFLKSKFAELSRRYDIPPSTWPREDDMKKLVEDASGQFIYAATVARFVDAPPRLPQEQLDIVLKIRPSNGSSPFSTLDLLYTAILNSSPSPEDTILWLRAIQLIEKGNSYPKPSAWTINRLFESNAGQARMLLTLPSLMYLAQKKNNLSAPDYDFSYYDTQKTSTTLRPNGWNLGYSFYHKSFLDFLEEPARCGAVFSSVDDGTVEQWIWERLSGVLLYNGPAVAIEPVLLPTFKKCFGSILADELIRSQFRIVLKQDILARCEPAEWFSFQFTSFQGSRGKTFSFLQCMFILVHNECRPHRPCAAGCKRWRKAISALPRERWNDGNWSWHRLLLDRFCIPPIRL